MLTALCAACQKLGWAILSAPSVACPTRGWGTLTASCAACQRTYCDTLAASYVGFLRRLPNTRLVHVNGILCRLPSMGVWTHEWFPVSLAKRGLGNKFAQRGKRKDLVWETERHCNTDQQTNDNMSQPAQPWKQKSLAPTNKR